VIVGVGYDMKLMVGAAKAIAPAVPDRHPGSAGLKEHRLVAWFVDVE
jgi:hypothetical protein